MRELQEPKDELRRVLGDTILMGADTGSIRPRGTGILARERPWLMKWSRMNFRPADTYHEHVKNGNMYIDANGQWQQGEDWKSVEKVHAAVKAYPMAICIWAKYQPSLLPKFEGMDWMWLDENIVTPSYVISSPAVDVSTVNLIWLLRKETTRPNLDLRDRLLRKVFDVLDSYTGNGLLSVDIPWMKSPHISMNPYRGLLYTSSMRYNGADLFIPEIREAGGHYESKGEKIKRMVRGSKGGWQTENHIVQPGQQCLFDFEKKKKGRKTV